MFNSLIEIHKFIPGDVKETRGAPEPVFQVPAGTGTGRNFKKDPAGTGTRKLPRTGEHLLFLHHNLPRF